MTSVDLQKLFKWHRRCFILFSLWPFCSAQQPWASAASASTGMAPWSLHRVGAAGHHHLHSTDPRGVSEPGLRNWLFPLSLCPRTSPPGRRDIKILFLQAVINAHLPPEMYYHWKEVTAALLPIAWHLSPSPMLAIISFLFPPPTSSYGTWYCSWKLSIWRKNYSIQ